MRELRDLGATRVVLGDVVVEWSAPPAPPESRYSPEEREEMRRVEADRRREEAERLALWSA